MQTDSERFRREIGRQIREARLAEGLSQDELALAAGLSPRALAYVELGEIGPRVDTVQRLLAVLGLTLEIVPRSAQRMSETDANTAQEPRRPTERGE
jgi:transcriptional regulator with XRE-family HTH domain